ncbi:hypothetical protein DFJ58DRAFT_733506 [Suillus subalutaceus]|uniref:uncharacterized protein n=1 Tax=Suillus subalutaceus TaxID=48586 RepID=UPI001B87BC14|nr:uncharacterized protein DFJ58DRAFT_733506 [Suillus subalutaceus]KAG1839147.1 hypothetical protein DFJ58DRAFT_733506 [Suillus subalutaceus]
MTAIISQSSHFVDVGTQTDTHFCTISHLLELVDKAVSTEEDPGVSSLQVDAGWKSLDGIPCIMGGITALVASVGGTLRGRTSNDFPWKTLPKELARLGCRLVNYPDDTLMPGEIRPTLIRSKGIHDLTLPHRVNLVNALKMGTLTIQAMTNDTARKRLTMSWDPVIIAEAPSYRSNHSRARRVFANGDIDFRGPRRLCLSPFYHLPLVPLHLPIVPLHLLVVFLHLLLVLQHVLRVLTHLLCVLMHLLLVPPAPAARPAIHPTRRTQVFVEISRPPPRPASRAIPSSTARTISRPLLRITLWLPAHAFHFNPLEHPESLARTPLGYLARWAYSNIFSNQPHKYEGAVGFFLPLLISHLIYSCANRPIDGLQKLASTAHSTNMTQNIPDNPSSPHPSYMGLTDTFEYMQEQFGGGRRNPSPPRELTPSRLRSKLKATERDAGLVKGASTRRQAYQRLAVEGQDPAPNLPHAVPAAISTSETSSSMLHVGSSRHASPFPAPHAPEQLQDVFFGSMNQPHAWMDPNSSDTFSMMGSESYLSGGSQNHFVPQDMDRLAPPPSYTFPASSSGLTSRGCSLDPHATGQTHSGLTEDLAGKVSPFVLQPVPSSVS